MRLDFPRLSLLLAALGIAAVTVTALAMHPRAATKPVRIAAPRLAVAPVVAAAQPVAATPAAGPIRRPAPPPVATRGPEFAAPGTAGMRIQLDPETGAPGLAGAPVQSLSATPEEAAALSHSSEGLRQVVLPDGSVMMDLQGRFEETVVMEIGPDGKLRTRCVQRPPAAGAVPAPTTEVLK